jgi:hypothetical protein
MVGLHELQNSSYICKWRFVVAALFALGQFALASNAPLISGSYEAVQKANLGSQAQDRIRVHLVNHGPNNLSIKRMTLWDFSHPDREEIETNIGNNFAAYSGDNGSALNAELNAPVFVDGAGNIFIAVYRGHGEFRDPRGDGIRRHH